MSEDIELMSLEHINNVERYVVVKGLKDIGHDRTKRLCATARAAHKLKQRVEELEQKHSEMKAHLIEIDQWGRELVMDEQLVEKVAKAIKDCADREATTDHVHIYAESLAKAAIQATGVCELRNALQEMVEDYEIYEYNTDTGAYDIPGHEVKILDRAKTALSNQDT